MRSEDLWTLADAAAVVGVPESVLHTWHKRGYLEYAGRRGRRALVRLEDVFAAERARRPGRPRRKG